MTLLGASIIQGVETTLPAVAGTYSLGRKDGSVAFADDRRVADKNGTSTCGIGTVISIKLTAVCRHVVHTSRSSTRSSYVVHVQCPPPPYPHLR